MMSPNDPHPFPAAAAVTTCTGSSSMEIDTAEMEATTAAPVEGGVERKRDENGGCIKYNNNTGTGTCVSVSVTEEKALLEKHHVILGRYNNGKKVKALTPAVEVYKKVRSQIRRTKYLSSSEVHHIKNSTSLLLQEELGVAEAPPITFWVDVSKAKQAGKFYEFRQAHPQLRYCNDFDGEEVVFVQDHQDFFLKADIDTKRRKCGGAINNINSKATEISAEASVVSACSASACSRTTASCSAAQTISTIGSGPLTDASCPVRALGDDDKKVQPLVTPPCPAATVVATTMGPPKIRDNYTRKTSMEVSVISACSGSTSACDNSAAHTVSSLSSNTPPPNIATFAGSKLPVLFQLEVGSVVDIAAEVDQICCRWICEGPELEVIKRKTSLVETFMSYFLHYQKILCGTSSPFLNSPALELQHLNETLLVHSVNVMGNSMVEWFEKYPTTCLQGEENAWIEQLQQQQQNLTASTGPPPMRVESDGCLTNMQVDSDIGGMEVGSVGTYDGSEEMQAALSDDDRVTLASHYLSEFSLSSETPHGGTPAEQWHFTGILVGEGEQVGERICIADWLGAEEARKDAQQQGRVHQDIARLKDVPGTADGQSRAEWSPVCRDQEHNRAMQDAEWAPVCRDEEHNRAMQDADQAQKEKETSKVSKVSEPRSANQKRLFQRFQSNLRGRSAEKKRSRTDRERRSSRTPWASTKPNSDSRNRSSSPDESRWAVPYPDQSAITNEAQLTILCRRLRHNDPTLKQVRIAGDLACAKALELTQAMGENFYHWDLRPVWEKAANRKERPSYLVLKQIEPTLWEDSQTSSE